MTQPPHVTTEVLSEPADPPGQRRRRLVLLVAAVAAVALVTGAVTMWHRIAAHRAEQVEITWTGIPKCTGADVVAYSRPFGPEWSGPLIKAERGMRCIITVEVRNHSGGNVHLDHALLPLMGPRGGGVIKVDTTTDPNLWSSSSTDDIDVLRLLDTTLSPGETTTFDIPLVFPGERVLGRAAPPRVCLRLRLPDDHPHLPEALLRPARPERLRSHSGKPLARLRTHGLQWLTAAGLHCYSAQSQPWP